MPARVSTCPGSPTSSRRCRRPTFPSRCSSSTDSMTRPFREFPNWRIVSPIGRTTRPGSPRQPCSTRPRFSSSIEARVRTANFRFVRSGTTDGSTSSTSWSSGRRWSTADGRTSGSSMRSRASRASASRSPVRSIRGHGTRSSRSWPFPVPRARSSGLRS